jgi:hypothetical protein
MVKHSVESMFRICHSESPYGDEESKLQILRFAQDDSFVGGLNVLLYEINYCFHMGGNSLTGFRHSALKKCNIL